MINGVRSYLANLDGLGYLPGPLEEWTDPAYRAIPLSTSLQTARDALFGIAPSRTTVLAATRQFLAVLHAGALEEFVLDPDPRVTYLPLGRPGPPRAGLEDLAAPLARLEVAGVDALLALWGPSPAEPYLTWRNLLESREPAPLRLGAALLALAWRTAELRGDL